MAPRIELSINSFKLWAPPLSSPSALTKKETSCTNESTTCLSFVEREGESDFINDFWMGERNLETVDFMPRRTTSSLAASRDNASTPTVGRFTY